MFYKEILSKMLKEETNPVNKMYLHEINIKWEKISNAIAASNGDNKEIVDMLNVFRGAITNNKYKFNKLNSKGFIAESSIFSVNYLNDLVSVIINRQKIIDHTGIFWGCGKFNMNYLFSPTSFNSIQQDLRFEQSESPEVLFLGQKVDLHYRVTGKRNFEKHMSFLPLIVFHTFKTLGNDDMLYLNHLAYLSKNAFSKSRTIMLTEELEKNFIPDISSTNIDHVCVLTKGNDDNKISVDAVNELEKLINNILTENHTTSTDIKNTSIITRRR
ncbi:MAG: hypothetical protein HOK80_03120 [Candidatus Cloacimonetes bacterium]|jgi:hypothetical protein|nr:hypothetical protein [Candidatus Cloacimonadota bacterium]MBT5419857.1 hypothetical protein [Candidatus Cloacimonadota bacterium]